MAFGSLTTSYLQDTLGALPVVLQEKVSNQTAPTSYMYAPGSTTPLYQSDPTGKGWWYYADALG